MTDRWIERWHALLDCDRQRLNQGRAFQRSGRVTALRIEPGRLSGRVQGSRATPYAVEALIDVLGEEQWRAFVDVVAGRVAFAAGLLAGRLPGGLLEALDGAGVEVLGPPPPGAPAAGEAAPRSPGLAADTRCACGGAARCCAHLVALWEQAAARFAEDPFALFALRGRGRQRLLADLAARRRRGAGKAQTMPLEALAGRSWTEAGEPVRELDVSLEGPPSEPLRLLGDPPGWAGVTSAEEAFRPLVERAVARARAAEEESTGRPARP